jgi:protease-4
VYLKWKQGWITGLKYEDEMKLMMLQRTNSPNPKSLNSRIAMVSYRKYRGVAERVAGVPSGVNAIAVLRAGGPISRGKASSGPSRGGGVKNEDFVRLVRAVRLNKQVRSTSSKAPRAT